MRFNIVMGKLGAETFSRLWNLLERMDTLMIKMSTSLFFVSALNSHYLITTAYGYLHIH